MARDNINDRDWTEVAAKAQAVMALHAAGLGDKTNIEKAVFLKVLGLSHAEIADLIDSTKDSVRKTLEKAAKRPKGKAERADGE